MKSDVHIVFHSCGSLNEEDSNFCSTCGTKIAKQNCECGNELDSIDRFCNQCGKQVAQNNP
ncbi:double zinc ribbon domain-containing protein [Ureibacillus sp. MALMAid1270]|uniref:double zinc ribbon domain-containing protein n=1 Tax=Ureibacillus sp. MALMAid1270 TaxID=3411629 RepID=UPI003BA452A1